MNQRRQDPIECRECGGVYDGNKHGTVSDDAEYICADCNALWHHEDSSFCPVCGSDDIGGIPCPNDGMDRLDYEQARKADIAERKMDEKRLQGKR